MSNKHSKKNRMPTQVEIFQGARSMVALSAIQRSGGGVHQDKRDKKARKHEWRREVW